MKSLVFFYTTIKRLLSLKMNLALKLIEPMKPVKWLLHIFIVTISKFSFSSFKKLNLFNKKKSVPNIYSMYLKVFKIIEYLVNLNNLTLWKSNINLPTKLCYFNKKLIYEDVTYYSVTILTPNLLPYNITQKKQKNSLWVWLFKIYRFELFNKFVFRNVKTKTRSTVKFSKAKRRPQKGSGRSRQGSRTNVFGKHGGNVFSPQSKKRNIKINQKEWLLAIQFILLSKSKFTKILRNTTSKSNSQMWNQLKKVSTPQLSSSIQIPKSVLLIKLSGFLNNELPNARFLLQRKVPLGEWMNKSNQNRNSSLFRINYIAFKFLKFCDLINNAYIYFIL